MPHNPPLAYLEVWHWCVHGWVTSLSLSDTRLYTCLGTGKCVWVCIFWPCSVQAFTLRGGKRPFGLCQCASKAFEDSPLLCSLLLPFWAYGCTAALVEELTTPLHSAGWHSEFKHQCLPRIPDSLQSSTDIFDLLLLALKPTMSKLSQGTWTTSVHAPGLQWRHSL